MVGNNFSGRLVVILMSGDCHCLYVIYSADVPEYSGYQELIDLFVLPSFEIHINSANRLAATENFELPAEEELWLNSGEL